MARKFRLIKIKHLLHKLVKSMAGKLHQIPLKFATLRRL